MVVCVRQTLEFFVAQRTATSASFAANNVFIGVISIMDSHTVNATVALRERGEVASFHWARMQFDG